MNPRQRGKYQFSLGTMLLAIVAMSFLLASLAWVRRERQQQRQALMLALQAREVALRSVVLEEQRRSSQALGRRENIAASACPSVGRDQLGNVGLESIERLERENANLRQQILLLSREIDRLKHRTRPNDVPMQ
jgi:hypothetical protein